MEKERSTTTTPSQGSFFARAHSSSVAHKLISSSSLFLGKGPEFDKL